VIIDTLDNIGRYAGLGKHYETAVRFLKEADLSALPLGKTEIDGENVFANLADNFLDRDEMAWEAHQRYADIQLILSGEEGFGWAAQADYGLLTGDFQVCHPQGEIVPFTLHAGQFVIYLPGEPHSPGNPVKGPAFCRKMVIKVLHNI